jgi:tetratricopeptide (TPR) repeat protein
MIRERAQAALERGQEWEARGDPAKAVNAYREAIALEPDWAAPYRYLGALYLGAGRFDEAAATFRKASHIPVAGDTFVDDMLALIQRIQAGELDPAAYRYYALAQALPDDELDQRMNLCLKALALNPRYAAPYIILGRVLLAKGQPNRARTVLERGLTCTPTPYTRAMLLFNLGNVFLVSGLREKALEAFRGVVALNANLSATRFARIQLEAAAAGRI